MLSPEGEPLPPLLKIHAMDEGSKTAIRYIAAYRIAYLGVVDVRSGHPPMYQKAAFGDL